MKLKIEKKSIPTFTSIIQMMFLVCEHIFYYLFKLEIMENYIFKKFIR